MPKVHAPFLTTRTMEDHTFYMMGGVNYVRKKSSLTRKRVLKSPGFRKTRFYAGLMSQASKIGSVIYQALPPNWRQGWMYRAFTGEALQILKEERTIEETTRLMWERYVKAINHHGEDLSGRLQQAIYSAAQPPKGRRKKTDPRVERLKPYSNLLAEASKMASSVYNSLPVEERKPAIYQACVGEAMRLLQDQLADVVISRLADMDEGRSTEYEVGKWSTVIVEKESKSQLPVACTETDAVGPSDEALARVSGNAGTMVPVTKGLVKKSKKSNKPQAKNGLFYIPLIDATSPKRFARRRKHRFRLVGRSP